MFDSVQVTFNSGTPKAAFKVHLREALSHRRCPVMTGRRWTVSTSRRVFALAPVQLVRRHLKIFGFLFGGKSFVLNLEFFRQFWSLSRSLLDRNLLFKMYSGVKSLFLRSVLLFVSWMNIYSVVNVKSDSLFHSVKFCNDSLFIAQLKFWMTIGLFFKLFSHGPNNGGLIGKAATRPRSWADHSETEDF